MIETTPAVQLRSQVVSRVILALIVLAFVELVVIAALLFIQRSIPGELWLAFGNSSGALVALLINSKNDSGAQPVIGVPGGEPVAVETPTEEPIQEPVEEVEPVPEPARRRR